jgi:hypothetical protein
LLDNPFDSVEGFPILHSITPTEVARFQESRFKVALDIFKAVRAKFFPLTSYEKFNEMRRRR